MLLFFALGWAIVSFFDAALLLFVFLGFEVDGKEEFVQHLVADRRIDLTFVATLDILTIGCVAVVGVEQEGVDGFFEDGDPLIESLFKLLIILFANDGVVFADGAIEK